MVQERFISATKFERGLTEEFHGMISDEELKIYQIIQRVDNAPTAAVIPVSAVKQYLIGLLDEWDKLGDRKYDLPNIQVYNHVRKELDDLEAYCEERGYKNG